MVELIQLKIDFFGSLDCKNVIKYHGRCLRFLFLLRSAAATSEFDMILHYDQEAKTTTTVTDMVRHNSATMASR